MAERWATFDCYGTLIDWHGGIRAGLAAAGADERPELLERMAAAYEAIEHAVEGGPYQPYRAVQAAVLRALFDRFGLAGPRNPEALSATLPAWEPYPEVPETLRRLKVQGFRLGLLSNIDRDLLAPSLRKLRVPFDVVVTAEDVHSYKPRAAHWERFLGEAGVRAGTVWHVAQGLRYDIETAAALGFRTIWVNRLGEDPGRIRPDRAVQDLSGILPVLGA